MTDPNPPAPSRLPGQGIGGCLASALVIGGIALLLPGFCSLLFMGTFGIAGSGGLPLLWMITFLIVPGGIWLVVWAIQNR